jgi:hypothetical protein
MATAKIKQLGDWSLSATWQNGVVPASGLSPGSGYDVDTTLTGGTTTADLGTLSAPYNFADLQSAFAANNVTIEVTAGHGIDFHDIQGSGTLNVKVDSGALFWVTGDIHVSNLAFSDTGGQVALVGQPGTYSNASVNFNLVAGGDIVVDASATGSSTPNLTNVSGDFIDLGTAGSTNIRYNAVYGFNVHGAPGNYALTVYSDMGSLVFNHVGYSGPITGITLQNDPNANNVRAVHFSVVCFAAGTRILTDTGERMVESLMPGHIVLTQSGDELKAQPVRWLGHRRIDLASHPRREVVAPIRIRRGAVADNVPHSDLLVSPDHAILIDGKLICARQLVNGTTILQERVWTSVDYFHVELATHAILLAEGLPAESYLDTGNSGFFTNSGAPQVLHPDLTDETGYPSREAGSCAPFVWDEASVQPVWQRLADRAAAIGRPVPQPATTADADLRLLARSRTVKPIYGDRDLVIFTLPRGAREVRLVSRAASPTEARPWLEDRRRLGVRVARIVLRGADEVREVPVDHPDLASGWWAVERDGQVISRWTDGDAVLPLPAMHGDVMLEIHLAGTMTYLAEVARAA